MPGQERIDSLFDIPSVKKEFDEVEKMLGVLGKSISDGKAVEKNLKIAQSLQERKQAVAELLDVQLKLAQVDKGFEGQMTQLIASMKEMATANKKLSVSQAALATMSEGALKAQVATRLEKQRQSAAMKDEINLNKAAEGSLVAMRLELKKLQQEYDNLAASERKATQGRTMQKSIKELSDELKKLEAQTGRTGRNVGNYAEGFKEGFKDFAKDAVAAVGAFFGIQQAFDFFKESFQEFVKEEQEYSKLNNILSNLGRNDVFARLKEGAHKLAEEFKTVKSEDIVGVFQKLITYGKLTEKQINDLTPVIVNFSAKSGLSLEESAGMVLKALEGQGRALKEYGINIEKGSTVADNFGKVMRDLAPRVEGAAKAFGDTTAGQIKKTGVEIDELKKKIGEDLAPAVKGFMEMMSHSLEGMELLFGKVKRMFSDAFKGDKELMLGLIDDATERNKAENQRFAKYFLDQDRFSSKTKEAQEKLIKVYQQNIDNDTKVFNHLVAQGQKSGVYSNSIQTWSDLIARWKMTKEEAEKLMSENKVLGFGADKADKATKELEDYAERFKEILNEINQANSKGQEVNLDPLHKELAQAFDEYNKFFVQIRDLRDKDLKDNQQKLKKGDISEKQAAAQIRVITEKGHQDLLAMENQYRNAKAQIIEKFRLEEEKKARERAKKDFADGEKDQKKVADELQAKANSALKLAAAISKAGEDHFALPAFDISSHKKALDDEKNVELGALNEQLSAKKISQEDYYKEIELLDQKYKKLQNDFTIDSWEKTVKIGEDMGDKLFQIGITKKKNAIQDLENLQQRNYEKEVSRISGSTLAEAQKAASLQILEAQRQSQKEINERKQRELDQKRAKFERDKAIFDIVLNTAVAIARDLGDPFKIAIDAAVGAAQLAIAIAQPIPKYATGTDNHPGGPAIVGERGRELVISPGGEPYFTPDKSTLTYLEKGAKVIPHDEVNRMMYAAMLGNTARSITAPNGDDPLKREIRGLKDTMIWQTETLKEAGKANRPRVVVNNNLGKDMDFKAWTNKNVFD